MKILVITGSPHRRGTSMLLADEFSAGAEAAGHKVIRFDAASSRIEPCRACDYCRSHDTECIQMTTWSTFGTTSSKRMR